MLFGSIAEGRMRAAAVRLRVMFLLQEKAASASEAFAQKFTGVIHRRKILYGLDPFEGQ